MNKNIRAIRVCHVEVLSFIFRYFLVCLMRHFSSTARKMEVKDRVGWEAIFLLGRD